jgi:hypothetical protein
MKKWTLQLEAAIRKAEVALSSGVNLLANFERISAERKRRNNAAVNAAGM